MSLLRLFGAGWLRKSQRLSFVDVNGVRCKRLVLRDTFLAAAIEDSLKAFGDGPRFPALVTRFENEVWVAFVPGERLTRGDDADLAEVAGFFGELYARAPKSVALAQTSLAAQVQRDLGFLQQTGLMAEAERRDLAAAAERLAPQRLLLGFDYVDPVLKNFVRPAAGGPLCAVDVESLVQGRPLGTGIAKAGVHWMQAAQRERLLALLEPQVPGLRAQLPFVELCFLARWTKTKLLTGKTKFLGKDRFAPFRS